MTKTKATATQTETAQTVPLSVRFQDAYELTNPTEKLNAYKEIYAELKKEPNDNYQLNWTNQQTSLDPEKLIKRNLINLNIYPKNSLYSAQDEFYDKNGNLKPVSNEKCFIDILRDSYVQLKGVKVLEMSETITPDEATKRVHDILKVTENGSQFTQGIRQLINNESSQKFFTDIKLSSLKVQMMFIARQLEYAKDYGYDSIYIDFMQETFNKAQQTLIYIKGQYDESQKFSMLRSYEVELEREFIQKVTKPRTNTIERSLLNMTNEEKKALAAKIMAELQ